MEERILGSKRFGQVKVFTSERPGLGKTHEILKELKNKNLEPLFFPVSGRITSKKLFQRLTFEAKEKERLNKKYGLIIQLYDI